MRGTLRVISTPASKKAHRLIELRQVPTLSILRDIVGGELQLLDDFDTILHGGQAVSCKVFCRRMPDENSPNVFANMLWTQAMIRKHGFSETTVPHMLTGPVAVLFGDQEFLEAINFGRPF